MYFFDVFDPPTAVHKILIFYENGQVTSCTKRNSIINNYTSLYQVILYVPTRKSWELFPHTFSGTRGIIWMTSG